MKYQVPKKTDGPKKSPTCEIKHLFEFNGQNSFTSSFLS